MPNNNNYVTCCISKERVKAADAVPVAIMRPSLVAFIKKKYPALDSKEYISVEQIKILRRKYIENVLNVEKGALSKLDKEVVKSLVEHESIVKKVQSEYDQKMTFGQKMSDKLAEFGGSWLFIGIFVIMIVCWITVNLYLLTKPYDPYPFILLNLVLSCITAAQAPVILMSQNRREAKDRLRAENDYRINLKAELEIRNLHEKIDNLTRNQWQRLLEIQQMQLDLLEEETEHSRMLRGRAKR